jgi:hypothetical protein
MKEELKNGLIVLAFTAIILFLALPKSKSTTKKSSMVPSLAKSDENQYEQAVVGIKAVRSAINANETKAIIDELKQTILQENNIRVIESKGLLVATDRSGKEIAKEQ